MRVVPPHFLLASSFSARVLVAAPFPPGPAFSMGQHCPKRVKVGSCGRRGVVKKISILPNKNVIP